MQVHQHINLNQLWMEFDRHLDVLWSSKADADVLLCQPDLVIVTLGRRCWEQSVHRSSGEAVPAWHVKVHQIPWITGSKSAIQKTPGKSHKKMWHSKNWAFPGKVLATHLVLSMPETPWSWQGVFCLGTASCLIGTLCPEVHRSSVPAPQRHERHGVVAQNIPDTIWQHKTGVVAPLVKECDWWRWHWCLTYMCVYWSELMRTRKWAQFQFLAEEIQIHINVI